MGVGRSKAWELVRGGQLSAKRIGYRVVIPVAEIVRCRGERESNPYLWGYPWQTPIQEQLPAVSGVRRVHALLRGLSPRTLDQHPTQSSRNVYRFK